LAKPFINFLSKIVWFVRLSDWAQANKNLPYNDFPTNPDYYKRYELYEFILENYIGGKAISYMEFGVHDGETFDWWLKRLDHPDSRFYGFDTFEGLPEDWGIYKKGSFSNQGKLPPLQDERGRFYKGLFQESLLPFLKTFEDTRQKIILLDADLYSSTLFVLTALAPYLKKDDVILFDEFFAPQHEFMAYHNFLQAYTCIQIKPIAAANNYSFIAFQV
jgi:hypothetical protein